MKKSIATCIIFTIITCGLYSLYWFVFLTDNINKASNTPQDTSGGMALVLSLVTCGIYTYYWMYKMGEKLDTVLLRQSRGLVYLVLSLLGFGIISYILMQDSLNKL